MATPLSAPAMLTALRAEGLRVVEHRSWRTHNRNHKGPWGPVHGVMVHHTVTSGTAGSVELCYNGHSTLPGPLCHGVIAKDGTVYLVGNGRANHAGLGDDDVLTAVIAEGPLPADNEANTDGNRHFYGFECINLGDGKDPWPAAQLEAIERASAAICRAHQWSERAVIGHLEWQPGKIDPRGFTMASMRARIGDRIATNTPPPEEDDMPLTDDDLQKIALAVHGYRNKAADERSIAETGKRIPDAYAYLTRTHDSTQALVGQVDALEAITLTDAQIAAIAAAVASNPGLADAIADKLAARLAE